ncbi:MAG: tRNA (guanine-N7)-methyltransferase [Chlorobiaceae bacterium]|nr:tRNA (guanine-N7)-methyltransferase [Chlorobiaceae bacterium]
MDSSIALYNSLIVLGGPERPHLSGICPDGPIEVEIGFGDGDYLIRRARENPGTTFIGIEQKPSLIVGVSKKVAALQVDNIRFLQSCAKDAFCDLFTPQSLSRVYALFPDPWPKRKHIKYRLFSTDYLRMLNNRLIPDGEGLIVTDSEDYGKWIVKQALGTGFTIEHSRVPAQFNTRFERKWSEQGQNGFYQVLLKKMQHLDI